MVILTAVILLWLSASDVRSRRVPAPGPAGLLMLALCSRAAEGSGACLAEGIAGGAGCFLVFGGLYFLSRGEWMGGGDVKVIAAGGALLGFWDMIWALWIGCALAAPGCLRKLLSGDRRRAQIPLVPFISAGILWMMIR